MSDRRPKFQTAPAPWRSVGEVAAELTGATGRVAIIRLLERAGQGDADAFQQADQIRQYLGLEWPDLIEVKRAA